jgi:CheY-like chemotaxis protein
MLQNIIGNAVKFTEKGRVEITTGSATNGGIWIKVKDTGIGIPREKLPFIFDEFRQADERTSRKYGGTGLGLAIAKKYSILLEGNIEVESEPGQGTTFIIHLPHAHHGFAEAPSQAFGEIPASTFSQAIQPGNGKTLLLVEDSEPQIIQLTDILGEEGYKVMVARNGREALELVQRVIPDAMILDLMMPEADGFEVLARIRGLAETSSLPVLILSAKHVTKEELSFLKGNNIVQLIQKGDISRHDLLSSISKMVHPAPRPVKMARSATRRPLRPNRKPVVLLIEDNPDNNVTVQALLGDGYEITVATDGYDGLDKAKILEPDLILLDISLPGMDGFAVLDAIRENESIRETPVIAVTAMAMKGDREILLNHGFDGYIAKPVISGVFEKTINDYLNGKQGD